MVLERFLRLHKAAPEEILTYARQYGVLMLDSNGRPLFDWTADGREPIYLWRELSEKACALLNIAAALNRKRPGTAPDWAILDPFIDPTFPKDSNPVVAPYLPHGLAAARQAFNLKFDAWLRFARISFGVAFESKRSAWKTEIDYGGRLFSALVLQLLLVVVNADSLYFCSGCGLPYARAQEKRTPRPGQRNFCNECVGFEVPVKFADRDRRQRQVRARHLYVAGKSFVEIAEELNTKSASVRRWLKGVKPDGKT